MPDLAPHTASVPPSGIRRVHELAAEFDDVLMLAVGEPATAVAPHIGEAASAAWAADLTDYAPNGGVRELRDAVVRDLAARHGIAVDRERVWITVGATQAIHQALGLVLDAGDEVLVPDPGYTTFSMSPRMQGAEPVPYRLRPENGFLPDLDELESQITARTRAIIVNSPSNPLGVVFPRETLEALLAFARRHDLWVVSDEVYERFTWKAPHLSLAALDTDERVLTAFSLSKTYAMTGVRVGYLVTPPGMAELMRRVQEASISCVAMPDQYAAIAAIEGPQDAVDAAREVYRETLRDARAVLAERGIDSLDPGGSFYLWIDLSHATGGDVAGWAERFLVDQRVAVAPGSAFGRTGEGWIRVCAAADREVVLEGLRRLPARR